MSKTVIRNYSLLFKRKLSKMGNTASIIGNKTIYIIGAVVVTIAKPACEYTARLVIRGTNDAIDKKLDEICRKLGEISDVQVTQGSRLAQLESEVKSDLASIHTLYIEREGARNETRKFDDDIAAIRDALQKADASIVQLHGTVEKLPKKLEEAVASKYEEVTKKYSTYLHDEHTQIYEAVSKSSRVPKHAITRNVDLPKKAISLPPSPRGENMPLSADKSNDKLNSAFSKHNLFNSGVPKASKTIILTKPAQESQK